MMVNRLDVAIFRRRNQFSEKEGIKIAELSSVIYCSGYP